MELTKFEIARCKCRALSTSECGRVAQSEGLEQVAPEDSRQAGERRLDPCVGAVFMSDIGSRLARLYPVRLKRRTTDQHFRELICASTIAAPYATPLYDYFYCECYFCYFYCYDLYCSTSVPSPATTTRYGRRGTASGDYWGKYDRKISIRTGDGSDYFVARRLVHFFLSKDRPFIYTATNVALLSCRAFVLMSPRSARCGDVPRFLGEGRARYIRDMRNSTGQVPLG